MDERKTESVASQEMTGPGRVRAFSPFLAPDEKEQLRALLDFGDGPPPSFAGELRDLARRYVDDGESRKLRAICLLVADLFEQGWRVSVDDGRIQFEPPGISRFMDQTVEDVKARVRSALQTARQRQLKEPSVVAFLRSMERRAFRKSGHHSSVLDLIDDGDDLAKSLEKANDLSGDARSASLAHIIDPVVEICEAGRKCEHTGLNLIDIWRYFRHTWAHEYRPVPGRQMFNSGSQCSTAKASCHWDCYAREPRHEGQRSGPMDRLVARGNQSAARPRSV